MCEILLQGKVYKKNYIRNSRTGLSCFHENIIKTCIRINNRPQTTKKAFHLETFFATRVKAVLSPCSTHMSARTHSLSLSLTLLASGGGTCEFIRPIVKACAPLIIQRIRCEIRIERDPIGKYTPGVFELYGWNKKKSKHKIFPKQETNKKKNVNHRQINWAIYAPRYMFKSQMPIHIDESASCNYRFPVYAVANCK